MQVWSASRAEWCRARVTDLLQEEVRLALKQSASAQTKILIVH
eukprot:SAG11_NODE_13595_length_648_cov_0.588342_1_plen_42_part_10